MGDAMKRFVIEISKKEKLTSHSGVALVGLGINRFTSIPDSLDKAAPLLPGAIRNADITRSYVGLLSIGKNDYQAIEQHRGDGFFKRSLGISRVPSEPTLRQRFDEHATAFFPVVHHGSVEFIKNSKALLTPLYTGHVALDIDVFTMDNSDTKKEGVSRTYQGYDGFAPIAAYLANEGWMVNHELRPGSQHSQKEFAPFLRDTIFRARLLTKEKLLARMDSAHDALENRQEFSLHEGVDYIIKYNPRKDDLIAWRDKAFAEGVVSSPHTGKKVAVMSVTQVHEYEKDGVKHNVPTRLVLRVTERTTDKKGNILLIPDIQLEGWRTSLTLPDEDVIKLYHGHGTSEQFHSEFKTDLGLERMPSGKFETNKLVFACAALAYNILRFIGQIGLLGNKVPLRHPAKRRRIRTVIEELMYFACRIINTGRRTILRFSGHVHANANAFIKVYDWLAFG